MKISKGLIVCIILATMITCIVGCTPAAQSSSVPTKKAPETASEFAQMLKDSKLPIDNVIVYTAETDENKLLGRPNQYIDKCNFADTRLEQSNPKDPVGGSFEIFKSEADAAEREKYLAEVGNKMPMFVEYHVLHGKVLLRLSKELTPDQVKEYEATLK